MNENDVTIATVPELIPEPCPVPTDFVVDGCKDAAKVNVPNVILSSLGRIVQVDLTLKSICPGKRVAVSLMLSELDDHGLAHPRGVKHILVPAQAGDVCRDIILRCIPFSVPEALDATGNTGSICNTRRFQVQAIANYVDTDFVCCQAEALIP